MYNYQRQAKRRHTMGVIRYTLFGVIMFIIIAASIGAIYLSISHDSLQQSAIYFGTAETIYLEAGDHFEAFSWHGDTLWVATSPRGYNEMPQSYKIYVPAAPTGQITIQER